MTKMIKVKYNKETTKVEGFYPSFIKYNNIVIDEDAKTIDGSPYIEITEEEHQEALSKQMAVVDGKLIEYVSPTYTEDLRASLQSAVNSEASDRIVSEYPLYKQNNLTMALCAIQNKELCQLKKGVVYELTKEDIETIKAYDAMQAYILNCKSKCTAMQESLEGMTKQELESYDVTNDTNWN